MTIYSKKENGILLGAMCFSHNKKYVNIFQDFGTDKYRSLKKPLDHSGFMSNGFNAVLGGNMSKDETAVVLYTMNMFYGTLKNRYGGAIKDYYNDYMVWLLDENICNNSGVIYVGECKEWQFEYGVKYLASDCSCKKYFDNYRVNITIENMCGEKRTLDFSEVIVTL